MAKAWTVCDMTWDEFCAKGLAEPGTEIRYKSEPVPVTLLIGDINPRAGVCDCCLEFMTAQIVAYRILDRS